MHTFKTDSWIFNPAPSFDLFLCACDKLESVVSLSNLQICKCTFFDWCCFSRTCTMFWLANFFPLLALEVGDAYVFRLRLMLDFWSTDPKFFSTEGEFAFLWLSSLEPPPEGELSEKSEVVICPLDSVLHRNMGIPCFAYVFVFITWSTPLWVGFLTDIFWTGL